ncbi:type II toxin-antitoxin system TacA family antitoxin [Paraburkholderia guartelaensis]|uniref:hypothetical protein n=1 Tax=Paraburkholderia guartelaensis TaxID=2546446 RepID=UPI002AB7B21E|nr:hypothetical protein [Paraburkholderia guartelaensis]
MGPDKNVGLTFRVTPRTKRMLEAAATLERRSLTNMFEILVEDYCRRQGIGAEDGVNSNKDKGMGTGAA